jgi:hypothetical protein
VWYETDLSGLEAAIGFEGYTTLGGYDETNLKVSRESPVKTGVNQLENFEPISWSIREGDQYFILSLFRNDQTMTDRYSIRLQATSSPGVVPQEQALLWPFADILYIDFEKLSDFEQWSAAEKSSIGRSSEEPFSGAYSMAVTTEDEETTAKVFWNLPPDTETVIGQVFWKGQEGVNLIWAQACAWACVPIDLNLNQWNTFTMDFSELLFDGTPLSELNLGQLVIQLQEEGASSETPYTFYLDGIQFYSRK